MNSGPSSIEASLFVTCIVDQFFPEVGESTVRVLRRLGVNVSFPEKQTCCGQPAFNNGYWSEARPLAKRFLEQFRGAEYIVAPSGSCTGMVKEFYPELLREEPELVEEAKTIGSRTYELSEFIVDVLGVTDLSPLVQETGARTVTYHEACHLRRELGITEQPRTLISSLPGIDLVEMDQVDVCCGFGGTFSIKFPDISAAMVKDKIANIVKTGADTLVSCDCSCLMNIAGGMEKQGGNGSIRALHLAQLLDERLGPAG